jgi:hypothetical protein
MDCNGSVYTLSISSTLKTEAVYSSETLVLIYQTASYRNPANHNMNLWHRNNLTSKIKFHRQFCVDERPGSEELACVNGQTLSLSHASCKENVISEEAIIGCQITPRHPQVSWSVRIPYGSGISVPTSIG